MLLLWLLLLVVTVKGDPFWTTVTLQDVTFQEGCIVDKNCDNMVFSIILEADEKDGRKQASWNLDSLIKNPSESELHTYWQHSIKKNITVQSLLTATDVLFNIPRPCDRTNPLRSLIPPSKTETVAGDVTGDIAVTPDETRIVGLAGKCFHAVVQIKLFTTRCPWCSASKEKKAPLMVAELPIDRILQYPWLLLGIIVCLLLCISGIALGSFCLHKAYQVHKYNEHYSSSLPDTVFSRKYHPGVNGIPVPPIFKPPVLPKNPEEMYIYPQYETLEGVTTKASNYDSAVESGLDHSDSDTSPNSSFSEKSNVKAEFV